MSIDEFASIKSHKTIAGIDLGSKRIGIAISPEMKIALPLCVIERSKWKNLSKQMIQLFKDYNIGAAIIGNPIHMNGKESRGSQSAYDFTKSFNQNFIFPMFFPNCFMIFFI